MKKAVLILSAISIISCKTDNNSSLKVENENVKTETLKTEDNAEFKTETTKALPKFATLEELLKDAGDFNEEDNSLKFISRDKKKLHVQVSKTILKDDLESVKTEIVKRDIIYIAFQTFAQTDINELTITSIPIDYFNRKKYFENYKLTVNINREKAKDILKKYLETEDFSILYEEQDKMWLPSKKFSILKFEKLNEVFNEMSEK
jgi:hypothetical protein